MNNNLQIFNNTEFGSIRILMIDGEPWFVGRDIAEILGYENGSRDINRHVDDEDKRVLNNQNYQSGTFEIPNRGLIIINESGVYSLILSSKLPKAKEFKHWVTSDILPAIRKTGGYVANEDMFIENYLPFADENTKTLFKLTLNTINQLNNKIESDKPLVEFANHIQVSEDCISMNDMAKLANKNGITIGRNRLFAFLRNKKVLKKDNIPYQRYMSAQPWFQIKETTYGVGADTHLSLTTFVTSQGQQGIINMLKRSSTG